ncbi:hypothetical protein DTO013E5_4669 [Penicillium roqueforti]|nr:hypothetical protein DTO013F2_10111 [Penicillium roqueforti]KAI2738631.1 hypothetical protein DTO012A1_6783 [Penicillium roqueforti]KAI3210863.1 hypothetical protein DTO013E5_4669 [Penicillium roqueforti]
MAEVLATAPAIATFATLAFQSSVALHQTVQSLQSRDKMIRELLQELDALQNVLQALAESIGSLNVDLASLEQPLMRCTNACGEFNTLIKRCTTHSTDQEASRRDWLRLRYMGEDISGFRNMVAGYKSTISIALAYANLRSMRTTRAAVEEYEDFLEDTKCDLESHLDGIRARIQTVYAKGHVVAGVETSELQVMEEEKENTQMSLKICEEFLSFIDQSRRGLLGDTEDSSRPVESKPLRVAPMKTRYHDGLASSVSTLGLMTDETLQDAIRYSGQGRLREADALPQTLRLEHLKQLTNNEINPYSARHSANSSSNWLREGPESNNKSSADQATDSSSLPVGDCESDISKPPSVFSLATVPLTAFTTDTRLTAEEIRTAIDKLVCIFLEDTEIDYLFREAISKHYIAFDRLDRNFRRLLKQFATNLKDEAQEAIDVDLANLIFSRARLVAEKIGTSFKLGSSGLDNFPQSSPRMHGSFEFALRFAQDNQDVSSDEDDRKEPIIDDRFARLVSHGRSFIEESAAFQKLRVELKNFLMPTFKPIFLDFRFDSDEWMIRCFWCMEKLLSSIGPLEESDSSHLFSTRPSVLTPSREIVLFSEPIALDTNVHSTELPTPWSSIQVIGFLGLSFKLNRLQWAR